MGITKPMRPEALDSPQISKCIIDTTGANTSPRKEAFFFIIFQQVGKSIQDVGYKQCNNIYIMFLCCMSLPVHVSRQI